MLSAAATGELFATAALVLFSCNIVLTKLASGRLNLNLGFLVSVAVNVLFAALLLAVHLAWRSDGVLWNSQGFYLFLLAGGFSTFLGRWFFLESVVRFGPSRASIFQVTSPLFTALLAWIFLRETLQPLEMAGMGLAIGGLLLVVPVPGFLSKPRADTAAPAAQVVAAAGPGWLQSLLQSALLMGLGSSLAYSLGSVFRGAAIRRWDEAVLGALIGAVGGLVLHTLFSRDKKKLPAQLKAADRRGMLLFAASGVLTISAQLCLILALKYIPVSVASLITLCTPVLVFPMSYLLLKNSEEVTPLTLLGGALTLAGVALIVVT